MVFPVLEGNFIPGACGMPAALVVRDITDASHTMAATIADFVEAWAKNATCGVTGQQTAPPADTFLCGFWTVAEVEALGLVVTYSQETGGYSMLPFFGGNYAFNGAADGHLDAIVDAVKKLLPKMCTDDMAKGFVTERALVVAAIQHYLREELCEIKHSISIGVAAMRPRAGKAAICSIDAVGVQQLFAQDQGQGVGFSSISCDWNDP
jgi:hypothetical protein